MISVLFVCHGNICRSPISEFVMNDMVTKRGIKAKFYIASAATSTEEIWNEKSALHRGSTQLPYQKF